MITKTSIEQKLWRGFGTVVGLLVLVAVTATVAIISLWRSSDMALQVGARLNSIGLSIQVNNQEASRHASEFLLDIGTRGVEGSRKAHATLAHSALVKLDQLAKEGQLIAGDAAQRRKFASIEDQGRVLRNELEKCVKAIGASVMTQQDRSNITLQSVYNGRYASRAEAEMAAAQSMQLFQSTAQQVQLLAAETAQAGLRASMLTMDSVTWTGRICLTLIALISLGAFGLASALSGRISRGIVEPVQHLTGVAEHVSMGNLGVDVRRTTDDEIGELEESLSRLVTAVKFYQMANDFDLAMPAESAKAEKES